jgi:hypothetical protein
MVSPAKKEVGLAINRFFIRLSMLFGWIELPEKSLYRYIRLRDLNVRMPG